jgi:hypothetical protein
MLLLAKLAAASHQQLSKVLQQLLHLQLPSAAVVAAIKGQLARALFVYALAGPHAMPSLSTAQALHRTEQCLPFASWWCYCYRCCYCCCCCFMCQHSRRVICGTSTC